MFRKGNCRERKQISGCLGLGTEGGLTIKMHKDSFFFSFNELFIGLLPCQGMDAQLLLPLMPQNFGVIDLRHHSAVHNPAGRGLLDGL